MGMEKLDTEDQSTGTSEAAKTSAMHNCFNPKTATFRYVGFVLMCLLGFGLQYCYDNPGALQDKFKSDLNMPASKFGILYSVYSWPNVFLCFVGGFLLDRVFGLRRGTIIYASLVLIGQLIFAMGTYLNIFWLMVLGRFVFGCGSESLCVAGKSYTVLWFKGRLLSTLLALQSSFSQMSATLNPLTMGYVYKFVSDISNNNGPESLGIAFGLAAVTCVVSVVCSILLSFMDNRTEKVLKRNEEQGHELIRLTGLQHFPLSFWLLVLICASFSVVIYPFMSLAKLYFMTKYELKPDTANIVISLVYTISAVACPFFGIIIDKTQRNLRGIIISTIGALLSHGLLAFTYISPYFCMVLLGLSYSLYASSLWSMIAFVVPKHQLGTAYGITQSFMNLNLAVTSIVGGIIVDNYTYFELELFFLTWILVSLVAAVVSFTLDSKSEHKSLQIEKSAGVDL